MHQQRPRDRLQRDGGADAQLVRERLDMYNVGVTGVSAYYPCNFFVKSERGETAAA
jgi:hypothetical protein